MTRSFECSECGASAFTDEFGINHHGEPDEIDYDSDGDHVALDPSEAIAALPPEELSEARHAAAQEAFSVYDFGTNQIEDMGGWETTTPGLEMTRAIYLSTEEGGPTQKAHFTVRFKDSQIVEVLEAYAIDEKGQIF